MNRRGFLALAPAALIGWAIAPSVQPPTVQPSLIQPSRLLLQEFTASSETGGMFELTRYGNTVFQAHIPAGGCFRWVAAPGGEIAALDLRNGSLGVEVEHMVVRHNGYAYAVNADGAYAMDLSAPPLSLRPFAS